MSLPLLDLALLDLAAAVAELSAAMPLPAIDVADPGPDGYDTSREAAARLTASAVAHYAEGGPAFDPAGKYLCGSCCMRVEPDACAVVSGPISMGTGSCEVYQIGLAAEAQLPVKMLPTDVLYTERPDVKAFGCTRCEYGSPAQAPDTVGRTYWCRFFGCHIMAASCCAMNRGKDDVTPGAPQPSSLDAASRPSAALAASTPAPHPHKIIGFTAKHEVVLRHILSQMPPHLTAKVHKIRAAPELHSKHGHYDIGSRTIKVNPKVFTQKTKYGSGSNAVTQQGLVLPHEVGHAVYEDLSPEEQASWRALSGWKKGSGSGQAKPYVEKRSGWPPYIADESPSKDAQFTRKYASKNADEDFADSFAYFVTGNKAQVPDAKRAFIARIVDSASVK